MNHNAYLNHIVLLAILLPLQSCDNRGENAPAGSVAQSASSANPPVSELSEPNFVPSPEPAAVVELDSVSLLRDAPDGTGHAEYVLVSGEPVVGETLKVEVGLRTLPINPHKFKQRLITRPKSAVLELLNTTQSIILSEDLIPEYVLNDIDVWSTEIVVPNEVFAVRVKTVNKDGTIQFASQPAVYEPKTILLRLNPESFYATAGTQKTVTVSLTNFGEDRVFNLSLYDPDYLTSGLVQPTLTVSNGDTQQTSFDVLVPSDSELDDSFMVIASALASGTSGSNIAPLNIWVGID